MRGVNSCRVMQYCRWNGGGKLGPAIPAGAAITHQGQEIHQIQGALTGPDQQQAVRLTGAEADRATGIVV